MQSHLKQGVCVAVCLGVVGMAHAQDARLNDRAPFVASSWVAAEDSVLDQLRGGFEIDLMGSNLLVSFGFVRSVTINGELVSRIQFSLPDLAHITADQARQVSDALAQTKVIQSGLGNSVASSSSTAAAGLASATVVQNSLNNQNIQTLTQVDAAANSLQSLRSILVQGTLRDAILGSIGVH